MAKRPSKNKMKKILGIIVPLLLALLAWRFPELFRGESILPSDIPDPPAESELSVTFIDVGQGDSILIRCGGKAALIDTGEYENINMLTDSLDRLGVTDLDLAVGTHPHSDHIGSMATVIRNYKPEDLMIPNATHATTSFEKMLEAAEKNSCNFIKGEKGVTYQLGDAILTVLSPVEGYESENLNNWSIVIRLDYGDVSMLFTGDAEAEIEQQIMADGLAKRVNILKVGHHGSSTSNTLEFLQALDPEYAVIMLAANNDYGHPHRETVQNLSKTSAEVLRTDKCGDITFTVKDGEISYVTEK